MTPTALKRLYWPRWNAAVKACWVADRGTVNARALREEPADPTMPGPQEVERIAERLRGSQRLTLDHLRHAAHVLAIGRDKSSRQLSAGEFDRVLVVFELLSNPLSLAAVQRWLNPDLDARRRLIWSIEHCRLPSAYVADLCQDRFGTADWRSLRSQDLRQLAMTLNQRSRSHARTRNPVEEPHHA